MRMTVTKKVRVTLREVTDGLTLEELAEVSGCTRTNVRKVLKNMPDVYIDRWEPAPRKQYKAVWCVVVPPTDCPRPDGKVMKDDDDIQDYVRPWVGLTKNEVELLSYIAEGNTWIAIELAEAKLKEKNT